MGPSDEGGASEGYLMPTPVDYDSEEDRERNGWEWEAPRDPAESDYKCDFGGDALQTESGSDAMKTYQDGEVEGDLALGEGIPSNKAAVIVEGYQPFGLEDNRPVLVQAVPSRGLSFQLWPAAEALCHYLETAYGTISGRLQGLRVLELGAGTGLVGIFAAQLGADVILTDLPGVLENLRANVALNQGRAQGVKGNPLIADNPAVNGNHVVLEEDGMNRISATETGNSIPSAKATVRFSQTETDDEGLVQMCTLAGSRIGLTCETETETQPILGKEKGVSGIDALGHEAEYEAGCHLANDQGKTSRSMHRISSKSAGSVSVEPLSWGVREDVDALVKRTGGFDLVLASDVIYYDTLFEPLLQSLRWLTEPGVEETPRAGSSSPHFPSHEGCGDSTVEKASERKPSAGPPARALNPVSKKQIVLIAHLRRWKKDAKFFRKASKYFDVRLVYSHPPVGEARKGVEVFEMVVKN
ncbi:methyltransferase family protein [Klebsormidium nitens]|uniref:Methyltransferase family protein n=1 Tax=Klebsormidium nitens TaxID=105231 RepID=A0A1Y1HYS2_KLENI|nr:methyltransferase family protein [Klebsormidium nitens]|eukprot:GAQ81676.1 methyltransferase family protein [Klebsormidium nitens]